MEISFLETLFYALLKTIGLFGLLFGLVLYLAKSQNVFTFCDEKKSMIVTEGGKFHKLIYADQDYVYDEEVHEFKKVGSEKIINGKVVGVYKKENTGFMGIHYIGFPFIHQIEVRDFSWIELAGESGIATLKPRKEKTNHFRRMATYAFGVKDLETFGNLPIDVDIILVLENTSPYKARYNSSDWLQVVITSIESVLKIQLGSLTIDQIREMKNQDTDPNARALNDAVFGLFDQNIEGNIYEQVGHKVLKFKIIRFEQKGGADIVEAISAKQVVELRGQANIREAELELEASIKKAEAARKLQEVDIERANKLGDRYKWDRLAESSVDTYVEGSGRDDKPRDIGINIGNGGE